MPCELTGWYGMGRFLAPINPNKENVMSKKNRHYPGGASDVVLRVPVIARSAECHRNPVVVESQSVHRPRPAPRKPGGRDSVVMQARRIEESRRKRGRFSHDDCPGNVTRVTAMIALAVARHCGDADTSVVYHGRRAFISKGGAK